MRAIVNLALARGWVGKPGCGLMPIRGHSGVQGGRRDGLLLDRASRRRCRSNEENARRFSELWGFDVPTRAGPQGARDARRRAPRRARRPLLRRAATSSTSCPTRARPRGARAHAASDPHGHRALEPDARRAGRGRADPAGGDALRDPRRRDRDLDRAPRDPEPRDPGPADRRGAAGVGGAAGPRRSRAARSLPARCGRAALPSSARRSPRRSRSTRRSPTCGGRRLVPVRRAATTPTATELPDRRRARAFRPGPAAAPHRGERRRFAARSRPAAASSSTRSSRKSKDAITGATREAVMISAADAERLGRRRRAGGRCCGARPASFAAGSTWRRSRPGTRRSTGPRGTC